MKSAHHNPQLEWAFDEYREGGGTYSNKNCGHKDHSQFEENTNAVKLQDKAII